MRPLVGLLTTCDRTLRTRAMDTQSALLAHLADRAGRSVPVSRTLVRAWEMSGVQRIGFAHGPDLIFKWAREPFTGEADVLWNLLVQGVPVPEVFASVVRDGVLGMLMEDLGEPVRSATVEDAVTAALRVHAAKPVDGLPVVDRAVLAALPGRALDRLAELRAAGRWTDTGGLDDPLMALADHADRLSAGAELAPYGLCHSEFHPTSLHVGADGWRLLDWARAFVGPGLLDLASWQGTQEAADPASLRRLIRDYVRAGGPVETERPRAGVLAEEWALGWHRLWITVWYLDQSVVWMPDPARDVFAASVVGRHVEEARRLLWAP